MRRLLDVPGDREFELVGEARISAQAPDPLVDRLLGHARRAGQGGITASSSAHLAGRPGSPGLVGDRRRPGARRGPRPSTTLMGQYVESSCPRNGRSTTWTSRSWPTGGTRSRRRLRLTGRWTRSASWTCPPSPTADEAGAVHRGPSGLRAARDRHVPGHRPGRPGAPPRRLVQRRCRPSCRWRSPSWACPACDRGAARRRVDRPLLGTGLLTVDGEPVPAAPRGAATADAEARLPLALEACDGAVDAVGRRPTWSPPRAGTPASTWTRWSSPPGPDGEAAAPGVTGTTVGAPRHRSRDPAPARVPTPRRTPTSRSGWSWARATARSGTRRSTAGRSSATRSSPATPTAGYVDPTATARWPSTVTWPPQQPVWIALGVSIVALVLCLVVLVLDRRRRARSAARDLERRRSRLLWPPVPETRPRRAPPGRPGDRGPPRSPALVLATPPVGRSALAAAMMVASLRLALGHGDRPPRCRR